MSAIVAARARFSAGSRIAGLLACFAAAVAAFGPLVAAGAAPLAIIGIALVRAACVRSARS